MFFQRSLYELIAYKIDSVLITTLPLLLRFETNELLAWCVLTYEYRFANVLLAHENNLAYEGRLLRKTSFNSNRANPENTNFETFVPRILKFHTII